MISLSSNKWTSCIKERREERDSQASTTTTSTTQTDISNSWGTDPFNDAVIFASTQYINYNYTIVGGPTASMLGKTITVTIPMHTDIMKTNLGFFNQIYTSSQYNVVSRIPYFNHTIGNPTTYPAYNSINQTLITQNNKNSLVFLTDPSHQNTVGQGNWLDSLELQLSNQMTTDQQWSMSHGIQAHIKDTVASKVFETNFHFDRGHGGTASTTIGSSTVFHADIGQFSNAQQWLNYKYNYGFFIYSYHDPILNQDYLVVNYYTGEFGPSFLAGKLLSAPNQALSPSSVISTVTSPTVVNGTSIVTGTISTAYIGESILKKIHK